jgi:hypothetical protein
MGVSGRDADFALGHHRPNPHLTRAKIVNPSEKDLV